ncbi:MAG: cyclic nucleotide-binding domain-containing protein [Thermoanaerobaculia bacterium]
MEKPDLSRTSIRRSDQYRDRWSSFGIRTGILGLSERLSPAELARYPIFSEYDERFLEKLSPDISVGRWQEGAVLFEEGSYIDVAFFVVEGSVEVFHKLSGSARVRQPIFDLQRTSFQPAGADLSGVSAVGIQSDRTVLAHRSSAAGGITFLATMDFNLPPGGSRTLSAGDVFGEIGAMSGWPQSVTARTATECTLVQIRLPALRTLRKRSTAFKERLDAVYRAQSLSDQLEATPLFAGCDRAFLDVLKEVVELVSLSPGEDLTREGEPADALYLVRSGFVKLAQRVGEGSVVVNYLSKGMTLGEVELLVGDTNGWTVTASSVEYAELVKIRAAELQNVLRRFPLVERRLWESAVARVRESGAGRRNIGHSEFLQTALDEGLVQGNSILVIDLDSCTRCDDCVRACADTHGGRPRFLREGEKVGHFQIASACYHCHDPVCLVGCPTGAIHRSGEGHVVVIDEDVCIGCQSCARSCPYDSIVMHETGETWPDDMVPEGLRGKDRLVASKCDLCHTSAAGPACVRNCPNGCAYRVGSLEEFERLLHKEGK